MAEDGQVIRGINWRQTFPFTNIFRSFRIAIHLSKLILGLALFLTVYFGGSVLDGIWPVHARGVLGEVDMYEMISLYQAPGPFSVWRDQQQRTMENAYAAMLSQYNIDQPDNGESPDAAHARLVDDAHNRRKLGELQAAIIKQRDATVDQIKNNPLASTQATGADAEEAKRQVDLAITAAYDDARAQYEMADAYVGIGLFDMFYHYEVHQVTGIADDAVRGHWLRASGGDRDNVVDHVYNFFAVGPIWLIWEHTVFAVLFAIIFLFAWSLFGGAIARIAAVHMARDEKISVRQAMNFAVGKLLSYASAPVIPLLIVLVIGLLISVVALIANIPLLGPIVIGAVFILALLAGFVITLVLLGTAGGFNLMYPTIAVEGSDSFDAISRSFSYVYARPWRMLFYTAVAVTYGAVTYLFVHMFIWMMLAITHQFVFLGFFAHAENGRNLLDAMWPSPNNVGRLTYSVDSLALSPAEKIGAYFLKAWVMLLVSFLAAAAISLYFSTNTVIYFLMRGEVDATEMDDVYIEQADDELEPMSPSPTNGGMTTPGSPDQPAPTTPQPPAA